MIIEKTPLSIAEAKEYVEDKEENKVILDYLKKASKLTKEKTTKLKEEINALNNPKIKDMNIVKIIDFLPKSQEEVNRIFTEVNLNEEEINAILEITKQY